MTGRRDGLESRTGGPFKRSRLVVPVVGKKRTILFLAQNINLTAFRPLVFMNGQS